MPGFLARFRGRFRHPDVNKLMLVLLAAVSLQGALLQCVVLDHETGRPLARSTVTVEGIQGGQSMSRSALRTDSAGNAKFGPLADGAYIITVSREAFATQQYGQTGWNRPGLPLTVQGDAPIGIEVRLRRLATISGTVWDENQIGIPNAPVVAYTATRPAKLIAKATSDDRGMYRIGGLVPGTYVVRNAAKQFEDTLSIVPTFFPGGNQLTEARTVEIDLDHSAQYIDFAPAQGRLFHLTGHVDASPRTMPAAVDLISDTGRTTGAVNPNGGFSFENVAPGHYELFAQAVTGEGAGWSRVLVDHDVDGARLSMTPLVPVGVRIAEQEGAKVDLNGAALFARRKDLDGDGAVIPVVSNRTVLAPGHWEIAVSTAPNYYPAEVSMFRQTAGPGANRRADGWNPITVSSSYPAISVVLSAHPATLRGHVAFSANNAASQVPVFLETFDTNPEEPPQVRTTRADQLGNYTFTGLPPGRYLVVSSYDADPTSRASLEAAYPKQVSLKESAVETQDLEIRVR
jgi:hypothetical protein